MTKFDCGCRIMTEVISLNEWKEPNLTYLLKTFVNMCGKCGKETNEVSVYGKHTFRDGEDKDEDENVFGKRCQ